MSPIGELDEGEQVVEAEAIGCLPLVAGLRLVGSVSAYTYDVIVTVKNIAKPPTPGRRGER